MTLMYFRLWTYEEMHLIEGLVKIEEEAGFLGILPYPDGWPVYDMPPKGLAIIVVDLIDGNDDDMLTRQNTVELNLCKAFGRAGDRQFARGGYS